IRERLAQLGTIPMIFTVPQLGDYIAAEFEKWAEGVKIANIKVEEAGPQRSKMMCAGARCRVDSPLAAHREESNWRRFPVTSPRRFDHSGCIAARIIERDHKEGTVKTPDTP